MPTHPKVGAVASGWSGDRATAELVAGSRRGGKMPSDLHMKQAIANFFSLFTSTGTLICCALPSLLVAVGAGAAVASLIGAAPWLVMLSRHKEWLFLFAGLMIALNFILVYRPRGKVACEVGSGDDRGGSACEEAGRFNKVVLWIGAGIYALGIFAAYLLLPLQQVFG